ncbi:MAG: DUF126 domain-containing protein [Pseudomonadota bacterium]
MSAGRISATSLVHGEGEGLLLRLDAPISFWGGVDPATGRIQSPRHPQYGETIGGRVLAIPRLIGSSSSSAVLLELIAAGRGPAALILGGVDAILLIAPVVGRELGLAAPPAVDLAPEAIARLPEARLRVVAQREGAAEIRVLGER